MKSAISLALTAALASAEITIFNESYNECWFNEGAEWIGSCTDLFYWFCDKYLIFANESCVVRTFTDSKLQIDYDEIVVHYWPYGVEAKWMVALDEAEAAEDNGSNFDSFVRDLTAWSSMTFQNLITVPDPRPDTHEWYADWVDPFEDDCYLLTENPSLYDTETLPKLNKIDGMCGFKIQFDNYSETTDLDVRVMRDGASTLVSAVIAVAATSALFL